MLNGKEFEHYICEITGKPVKGMRLCPDKQIKLKERLKCDKGCVWCEKNNDKRLKGTNKENEAFRIRKIPRE